MPQFKGLVEVQTTAGDSTILIDGNAGDVTAGGNGHRGSLQLRDTPGATRLTIDGETGTVWISSAAGDAVVTIDGQEGDIAVFRVIGGVHREIMRFAAGDARLTIGSQDHPGRLMILDASGTPVLDVTGSGGTAVLGAVNNAGELDVRDYSDRTTVALNGSAGSVAIGTEGNSGDLYIRDAVGRLTGHISGGNGSLYLGAEGVDGDITVRDEAGRGAVLVDGSTAAVWVGTEGNEGDIIVRDARGRQVFHVDGEHAAVWVGADGNEGDIIVRDGRGRQVFQVDGEHAAVWVGADGNEGDLIVRDATGQTVIHLDGGSGDIILSNGDAAEDFELADVDRVDPGMVMVVADDGRLCPCSAAYDRAVVGVLAGAGNYRPGIVLDRRDTQQVNRRPVSIVGKVSCLADADYGPIRVGDLLTTSPTPGAAMRASDPHRAFGAVIGKALTPLQEGSGLVTLLIGLQ